MNIEKIKTALLAIYKDDEDNLAIVKLLNIELDKCKDEKAIIAAIQKDGRFSQLLVGDNGDATIKVIVSNVADNSITDELRQLREAEQKRLEEIRKLKKEKEKALKELTPVERQLLEPINENIDAVAKILEDNLASDTDKDLNKLAIEQYKISLKAKFKQLLRSDKKLTDLIEKGDETSLKEASTLFQNILRDNIIETINSTDKSVIVDLYTKEVIEKIGDEGLFDNFTASLKLAERTKLKPALPPNAVPEPEEEPDKTESEPATETTTTTTTTTKGRDMTTPQKELNLQELFTKTIPGFFGMKPNSPMMGTLSSIGAIMGIMGVVTGAQGIMKGDVWGGIGGMAGTLQFLAFGYLISQVMADQSTEVAKGAKKETVAVRH